MAQDINLIGLYTNKDFSAEDIMEHYEKNEKYFTQTIIRENMKDLINELSSKIILHAQR